LKETRNSGGTIDLEHVIEIADVDAELKGARCHNDAVSPLLKGTLRLAPFGNSERAMGDEGTDTLLP
jgi:hypothetical protein